MRLILTGLFIAAGITNGLSQFFEDKDNIPKNNIFLGGGVDVVGGAVTYIKISPLIGYWIAPKWNAGINFIYEYYKNTHYTKNIETNIYGISTFTEYYVVENMNKLIDNFFFDIFLHAEYEALNLKKKYFPIYNFSTLNGRFWYHSLLTGGGLNQKIRDNVSIKLMILWNIKKTENMPYNNPIIRIGFTF